MASIFLSSCGGGNTNTASEVSLQRTKLGGSQASALDSISLPSNRDNYSIQPTSDGYSIINNSAGTTLTQAANLKRVQFADVSLALDIDAAGKMYRLYQAAFNRRPDLNGIGFWLAYADDGHGLEEIAVLFLQSEEFQRIYGTAPTDLQFVTKLYDNVLHRAPDSDGLKFWLSALQNGISRSHVLVFFSESPENVAQIAPLIQNGVSYAQSGIAYRPVANAGGDQQAKVGAEVKLSGIDSTDTNNDTLHFNWSVSKPDGTDVTLITPSSAAIVFVPSVSGVYVAKLTVNDGKLFSVADTAIISVSAPIVVPVPDSGAYTCSTITHARALELFLQGHNYLDRDHDGKPCEATDITIEKGSVTPPPTTPSTGMCYVSGYTRKNGTHVSGYWRRC